MLLDQTHRDERVVDLVRRKFRVKWKSAEDDLVVRVDQIVVDRRSPDPELKNVGVGIGSVGKFVKSVHLSLDSG